MYMLYTIAPFPWAASHFTYIYRLTLVPLR